MTRHRLIIGTHAKEIHLVELQLQSEDEDVPKMHQNAPASHHVSRLAVDEQPSWLERHPVVANLIYVNSWVHMKLYAVKLESSGEMTVVDQVDTSGAGPTYFVVAADCSALIAVTYAGGTVERHFLDRRTGFFIHAQPAIHWLPTIERAVPASARLRERQGEPHPHQVIPLRADEYLIPDLGNDCVWYMEWKMDEWVCSGRLDTDIGSGPRHGVLSKDGQCLFLLHELACTITVHDLNRSDEAPIRLSSALQTVSTLPEEMRKHLERSGGFDFIACTILLSSLGGRSRLLVSNRNAYRHLVPHGDVIALFDVAQAGKSETANLPRLEGPSFSTGYGWHLRGAALRECNSVEGEHDLAVIMGRNGGGVSFVKIEEDGSIGRLINNSLEQIELPVAALWID